MTVKVSTTEQLTDRLLLESHDDAGLVRMVGPSRSPCFWGLSMARWLSTQAWVDPGKVRQSVPSAEVRIYKVTMTSCFRLEMGVGVIAT